MGPGTSYVSESQDFFGHLVVTGPETFGVLETKIRTFLTSDLDNTAVIAFAEELYCKLFENIHRCAPDLDTAPSSNSSSTVQQKFLKILRKCILVLLQNICQTNYFLTDEKITELSSSRRVYFIY